EIGAPAFIIAQEQHCPIAIFDAIDNGMNRHFALVLRFVCHDTSEKRLPPFDFRRGTLRKRRAAIRSTAIAGGALFPARLAEFTVGDEPGA
ncbi:hypothetical protein ABTP53_19320, partial [Acinetobacter baumannii]